MALSRNPSSGKNGMSQSVMSESELQRIDFIDLKRSAIFKDRENNGKPNGCFRRRNYHHEERVDVTINAAEMVRECHKAEVHGIQHEFNGHKHRNHAFAIDETSHAQRKKDRAQNQIPGQRYGRKMHYSISFCA